MRHSWMLSLVLLVGCAMSQPHPDSLAEALDRQEAMVDQLCARQPQTLQVMLQCLEGRNLVVKNRGAYVEQLQHEVNRMPPLQPIQPLSPIQPYSQAPMLPMFPHYCRSRTTGSQTMTQCY